MEMKKILQILRVLEVENWFSIMDLIKLMHLCRAMRKMFSSSSYWKRMLPKNLVSVEENIKLVLGLVFIKQNRHNDATDYAWEILCDCDIDIDFNGLLSPGEEEADIDYSNERKYLMISDPNLRHLPHSLLIMDKVEELVVQETSLVRVSSMIGRLKSLEILTIEDHYQSSCFQALPRTIGNLENLLELHIHQNQLVSLPESIGGLKRLEVLDVSVNKLEYLPARIGNLTKLRILDVSDNKLTSIPESVLLCTKLMHLRLAKNCFTSLPDFSILPMLKTAGIPNDMLGACENIPAKSHKVM